MKKATGENTGIIEAAPVKPCRRGYVSLMGVLAAAIAIAAMPVSSVAESDVPPSASVAEFQANPSGEPTSSAIKAIKATKTPKAQKAPDHKAKAKANGKSHINVSWSKVKGADGYTVYRSSKPDKLGKKIYTTTKASNKSYMDENAAVHEKHWYTVKAWKKTAGKKKTIAVIKANKVKNSLRYDSSFKAKTYAYSGGGTTASGKKAQVGRVAVDPRVIKLGTWLYVEGYGLCQAADTGGAIKGNKIDLYMNSVSECYSWGIRHKQVYVLE
jgi:3D (Asp-Asp-Asp) domain-containing protein